MGCMNRVCEGSEMRVNASHGFTEGCQIVAKEGMKTFDFECLRDHQASESIKNKKNRGMSILVRGARRLPCLSYEKENQQIVRHSRGLNTAQGDRFWPDKGGIC